MVCGRNPNLERTMKTYKVGYLIGSIATESINRKLANAMFKLAPEQLRFEEIPYRDLPIYSYDYDADFPEVGRRFKQAIEGSDAILIVTPEYNRSIPGGLKNAIDWASRPWGTNSFANIPSGVIGTSPGSIGTAVGQQHLRSILGFLNSPQMNAPEAYIQFRDGMINDAGEIADASTAKFLGRYLQAFHEFIARVLTVLPRGA
jgi:chromate reductase